MSDPNDSSADPAGLRGPGDPEAAKERQQQADRDAALDGGEAKEAAEERPVHAETEPGQAGNIREEQLTGAAGMVPVAYVGSGDPTSDDKPEDAVDAGNWDDET